MLMLPSIKLGKVVIVLSKVQVQNDETVALDLLIVVA